MNAYSIVHRLKPWLQLTINVCHSPLTCMVVSNVMVIGEITLKSNVFNPRIVPTLFLPEFRITDVLRLCHVSRVSETFL